MSFVERRILEKIAYDSQSGPAVIVDIAESAAVEQRVLRVAWPRHKFVVQLRDTTEGVGALRSAYIACRGPLIGFRFQDRLDYTTHANGRASPSPTDQRLGIGDGTTTVFDLAKRYSFDVLMVERRIVKPVAGTVRVAAAGVELFAGLLVDTVTGRVSFDAAPAPGTLLQWGGKFDVPARFNVGPDSEGWRALMQTMIGPTVADISVDLIEITPEDVLSEVE